MPWRSSKLPWQVSNLRSVPRHVLLERYSIYRSSTILKRTIAAATPPQLRTHVKLQRDNGAYLEEEKQHIKIAGLVRSIRKQKNVAFAHVADGSTYTPIQAILKPEQAKDISNGAYVELVGKWQQSPANGQSHELQVTAVQKVGTSNPEEHPIQKQSMTAEYLRSIPHMRIRTPFQSILARTRSRIIHSVGSYFNEEGQSATQIQSPIITSSDCEGAGEVFTITPFSSVPPPESNDQSTRQESELYFREPKYLTVSSQLHLEAYAAELGDVWTLSPTFRAEESDTPRHLAEFYMLEAEFRGITDLSTLLSKVENLIKFVTQDLRNHRTGKELLDFYADRKHRPADAEAVNLEERWNKLQNDYLRVDYASAISELLKAHEASGDNLFRYKPDWNRGLQLEHERWIVEHIGKARPIFVTDYPKSHKPFYMLPSSAARTNSTEADHKSQPEQTVACFDLLLPYGYCEVVGGSLREHRLPELISSMREKGLIKTAKTEADSDYPYLNAQESLGNMQWYADLRRFGSSPHGGYGLGFDRLLAYLTGISNVRDVVGFPRVWGRADC